MRSDCPVSFALDFLGDKWTFLVIRDLVQGKRFYKDFLGSKEGIATNILSDRLKRLETNGLITCAVYPKLRTKKVYTLTEKGLDLIPAMLELIRWSDKYQSGLDVTPGLVRGMEVDRDGLVVDIKNRLRSQAEMD